MGTEKYCIIALKKEEYPSTRIGRGKPAHGVDKLSESLNLPLSWNFTFLSLCVFVRVTLRLRCPETLRCRVQSIRREQIRRPDDSDLLDHMEGSVTSGSQTQASL